MNEAIQAMGPESEDEDVRLLIALLKLASMISRPMRIGVAERQDLSTNELRVLMCLGGEGAMAGHDISELMAIPPMNVSRALAALDERGWLSAMENSDNRRRRPMALSEAGRAAFASLFPDVAELAHTLFADIKMADRRKMTALSRQVIDGIDRWTSN